MSEGWPEAFTEKWARRKGEQFIPLDGNSSALIDEHFSDKAVLDELSGGFDDVNEPE